MNKENIRRICTVIGAFFIHTISGNSFVLGIINPYISSYVFFRSSENGTDLMQTEYISVFRSLFFGISPIISGFIANKIGYKNTVSLGSLLTIVGICLTYFTIKIHYLLAILTYGMINGTGCGFIYAISIVICQKHYPGNEGLVTGIVLIGDSFASFVFNPTVSYYVNPTNEKPNVTIQNIKYFDQKDILDRVPEIFFIIGSICLFLSILAFFLIKECNSIPQNKNRLSTDDDEELLDLTEVPKINFRESFFQLKNVIKNYNFIIILVNMFVVSLNFFVIINNWKEYGQIYINNDLLFSVLSLIISLFLIGGRVFCGFVADRFRFRNIIVLNTICLIIACAVFPVFQIIQNRVLQIFFYVCMLGVQFGFFGGYYSIASVPVAKMFGIEHLSVNYGLVLTISAITPLLGNEIMNVLIKWRGMLAVWEFLAAIMLPTLILNFTFRSY